MRYVETITDPLAQWCVHCGADVDLPEPRHIPTCPLLTGVYQVTDRELFEQFACCGCAHEFGLRESYVIHGTAVLCISCGALEATGEI